MQFIWRVMLLSVATLLISGCVTVHHQDGSKTVWNPIEKLSKAISGKTNPVDVYLATFDSGSWDLWDKIRRNPGTREALSAGTIRIKILAEALLITSFGVGTMNVDDELSLPPALLYERLLEAKENEIAYAYLDFVSKNRNLFHRELKQSRRVAVNKQNHAKIDRWLKTNGYPPGVQGLLGTQNPRALKNLIGYYKEFRAVKGISDTLATPVISVNSVENSKALDKLFRSDEKK